MTINIDKCEFAKQRVNFLGFEVSGAQVQPLPKKLEAISEYPAPQKPKQLLGYLGALNFYRRSLPTIDGVKPSEILKPLYAAATRKTPGLTFVKMWQQEGLQHYFDLSKKLLMQACSLTLPDPNLPLALVTDASNH